MRVDYHAWGNTERQDYGFDNFTVQRDGIVQAGVYSTGEQLQCAMQDHEQTNQEILPPGTYEFTFAANTVDGLYHVGMVHNGTITWSPL